MKKLFVLFMAIVLIAPSVMAAEFYYDLNDKKLTYDQLVSQPKTVLFIWATWCPTCREKVSELAKENNIRKDVNVIFINVGEKRNEVVRTLDALHVPQEMRAHVYLDPFQEIINRFYFNAVPTVLFFQDGALIKTAHTLTSGLIDDVYPADKNSPETKKPNA